MGVIVLNRVINLAPPKKAFADCTWEEVSTICKAGYAAKYWQIGDTKPMVDGETTGILRIIGFDHDPVTDAAAYGREKAGITLELADSNFKGLDGQMNTTNYSGTLWYSTSSMYHCNLRQNLLPAYLANKVPADLRAVLTPVDKEFYNGAEMKTISDTLFLLSLNEIVGGYTSGYGSAGEQYAYYAAGNTRKRGGAYWTRSSAGGANWYHIGSGGEVYQTWVASYACSYSFPCMCI